MLLKKEDIMLLVCKHDCEKKNFILLIHTILNDVVNEIEKMKANIGIKHIGILVISNDTFLFLFYG